MRQDEQFPPDEGAVGQVVDNEEERQRTMRYEARLRGDDLSLFPQVFRYGIQYRPTTESLRRDFTSVQGTKRSIVIFHLPPERTIREVLAHVRGGVLIRALKTDTGAMVEFYSEDDAKRYFNFAALCDIPSLLGPDVTMKYLETDTYPLAPTIMEEVTQGLTRCVGIRDFNKDSLGSFYIDRLLKIWKRPQDVLEDAWIGTDGHLYLLCLGYRMALGLWIFLQDYDVPLFKASDPCAKPLAGQTDLGRLARGDQPSAMDFWLEL
ncbi:hypothetical protein SLS62_011038 [Diatrype stigma]|uniref:Uncharacterized protein n=1 Tax=Diatrype stigma TaxID=117547 RepID=A0AAN9YEP0_9PEZI